VGAGRRHEERTKELGIGKGAVYAVPFRGATGAMEAVPRRDVYREGEKKEKGGENVENAGDTPLAERKQFDAKRFDQTFSKFDAWCESMEGRRDEEERSAEEGCYDINTQ